MPLCTSTEAGALSYSSVYFLEQIAGKIDFRKLKLNHQFHKTFVDNSCFPRLVNQSEIRLLPELRSFHDFRELPENPGKRMIWPPCSPLPFMETAEQPKACDLMDVIVVIVRCDLCDMICVM